MDTFRSNQDKEQSFDETYAYQSNDWPTSAPTQPKQPSGFGFNLFRGLRTANQPASTPTPAEPIEGAEFSGFPTAPTLYNDVMPVYRGQYDNLSPLYFNTVPVDNANDTRLDRSCLAGYTRAQLFFLLRLERFLRLRHHWVKASPRADESWKTELVKRGIFSALQDCVKHSVGDDARRLLVKWGCC